MRAGATFAPVAQLPLQQAEEQSMASGTRACVATIMDAPDDSPEVACKAALRHATAAVREKLIAQSERGTAAARRVPRKPGAQAVRLRLRLRPRHAAGAGLRPADGSPQRSRTPSCPELPCPGPRPSNRRKCHRVTRISRPPDRSHSCRVPARRKRRPPRPARTCRPHPARLRPCRRRTRTCRRSRHFPAPIPAEDTRERVIRGNRSDASALQKRS